MRLYRINKVVAPGGSVLKKKDVLAVMAAHRIPYVASMSLAHADDTVRKLRSAVLDFFLTLEPASAA